MKNPLSRRDFMRAIAGVGGMAVVSSFLEACSRAGLTPAPGESPVASRTVPSPTEPTGTEPVMESTEAPTMTATERTPEPTATQVATEASQEGTARVAFVQTGDRAEGVRRAIEVLGINPVQNKRVFLKPNFNSADPAPGSTHPDVLRALVESLWAMGASAITVGDRSGMGDTRRVMEALGVFRMADQLGFEVVVFDELSAEDWVMVQPEGQHWGSGFPFVRYALEAEAVVEVCCLKTHRYGGHFTMSLKNSVGLVAKRIPGEGYDYMRELHGSAYQRRMIAEINAVYEPALIVMDGVEAFVRGGPAQGDRVASQVALVGTDRVAMDAVGVAILRHYGTTPEVSIGKVFEQEQIARAVEMGLGVDSPEKIVLVTADSESEAYAQVIQEVLRG